jgi:aquaporin Z
MDATTTTAAAYGTSDTRQHADVVQDTIRKLVVELIGSFIFFVTVYGAVRSGSTLAPVAIGSIYMVMVFAGAHISGGHFNPAVTMAVLVRGRIGPALAAGYWIVQLAAGVLAALAVYGMIGSTAPSFGPSYVSLYGVGPVFVAELIFTFALAYVMLNVATSKDHPNNSFYGLAIGFTVLAGVIAVGQISGGVFNPAIYLGGAVLGLFTWPAIWIYFLAELAAAVIAGLVFRVLNPADQ